MNLRRLGCLVWIGLLSVAPLGCGGSSHPWGPQPIVGKITYEDGSLIPVSSLKLTFKSLEDPIDEKTVPRPGAVSVDVGTGEFREATTYKYADGVIPGRHKVSITANDEGGGLSAKVPREYAYAHTTPLEVDTADAPLHIKVRKP